LSLTDESVAALPYAKSGRGYIVRDTELAGLQCIVGRRTKRLVYQTEYTEGGQRYVVYKRLGDPAHVKMDEIRARAFDEMARVQRMTGPPDARAGMTLPQVWGPEIDGKPAPGGYLARCRKKERSLRTIADYRQKLEDHLQTLPALKDIRRSDVARLHDRLTDEFGPYLANGVIRLGHALFRHAAVRMEVPGLGANPFSGHDLNPETPRQTGMAETDLIAWFDQVMALDNPILRELQIVLLVTGLRRSDVTAMRWENVHKDYIDIPKPGKKSRPSKIPITPALRRSLDRVKLAAKTFPDTWVFPSMTSGTGHTVETKNKALDRSPHALRHTFRGMCAGAKVTKTHSKILMLHTIAGEIHDEYMSVPSMFAQLAQAADEVAAYILRHLPKDAERRLRAALRAPRAA
jgi:integrase